MVGIIGVFAAEPTAEGLAFFEKKIRPVLVEHCYKCHSANSEKVKGGLLVDTREGIRKGGESGPAVVPGNLKGSLLISALKHDDFEMPPKGMLPAAVIADFEKWIRGGAADPRRATRRVAKPDSIDIEAGRKHWAYQPLKAPAIPEVKDAAWPANDIDRFILAKLESAALQPGADAKKIILIRRLYFDLIGLPPTPEEIAQFVDDKSPAAYQNLVDRLMKSPRFGERWGRHWLDVVRYAESMSLRGRLLKHAWRYRDYVIEAFNDDLPYDQFLTQQLAGDLLEASSVDAQRRNLIATTFLVMGDALLENQNKRQLDMDVVDEQLDVIGKGLLAQTIACARCHDHKFDPIPTSDYYAMAGILKNVQGLKHANVSSSMEIPLPISEESKRELEIHNSAVAKLQREINELKPKVAGNDLLPVQAKDLPGVVVDNPDAKVIGKWGKSDGIKNRVGSEYLLSKTSGSKVIYPVAFPDEGRYEVRITIAQHANRSSKTLVTVRHKGGKLSTFRIDQRMSPGTFNKGGSDGYFQSLGFFEFPAGQWDAVEISARGGKGFVVADAVQFLAEGTPNVVKNETKPTRAPGKTPTRTIHVRLQAFEEIANRRSGDKTIPPKTQRRLTTLPAHQRMGILTHPNWLVAHSDAMDNHAILRGKWIRERLLGGAIADVPITVDAMLPDEPKESLRHRMRVTREKACWKCHQKMDPLGLPFEMFNHAGLFRTTELGKPVNTKGEITGSGEATLDGPVNNALEMIEKLSRSERVKQVFVRHAFRYWMGRNETINDAPVLQDAYKAYKENDGSMKALLLSLLTSDAFLYRKVPGS